MFRLLVSGGREGAVRAWDAAGAEGADVLAALDAGQGSQVSDIIHFFGSGENTSSTHRWLVWVGRTPTVYW